MRICNLLLLLCFLSYSPYAQTILFTENMEFPDSVTPVGNSTWLQYGLLAADGQWSMRDTIKQADSSYLETVAFSTIGFANNIRLNFSHIAKISTSDGASLEYSVDNGTTWNRITASNYAGTSNFSLSSEFNAASYNNDWFPSSNTATPNNSWWKEEVFELGNLISNTSQVKIRFKLKDKFGNGGLGNFGWVIDKIRVIHYTQEIDPPFLELNDIGAGVGIYYGISPIQVDAFASDSSGISNVVLNYTINGVSQAPVAMFSNGPDNYTGYIFGANVGDTICYSATAADNTPIPNLNVEPDTGCISVIYSNGINIPFFDDFEGPATNWVSQNFGSGSVWQLGDPNFGITSTTHSGVQAWDVELNAAYLPNTFTTLTSPLFDASNHSKLQIKFWHNFNVENTWDGTRFEVEYDNSGIWQQIGFIGDPNGVNWYTGNVTSLGGPGWEGNSPGWYQSSYKLDLVGSPSIVRFRFTFSADNAVETIGYTIDDFELLEASSIDAGVSLIFSPGNIGGSGASVPVTVQVTNYATDTLYTIPITYTDGQVAVTETLNTVLIPGATVFYTFTQNYSYPSNGPIQFCAFTTVANDSITTNDQFCKSITIIPAIDGGVSSIVNPNTIIQAGSTINVSVAYVNSGVNIFSNYTIGYIYNGNITSQIVNNSLLPGNIATQTFSIPFIVPNTPFEICAFIVVNGDSLNNSNDTLCITVTPITLQPLPYFDNFEGTSLWVDSTASIQTRWELGTPAFGSTSGAYSGTKCWDVNLNTAYFDNADCYLLSPYFDFNGQFNARLRFWHNFTTENSWDGVQLQYSTNGGLTWTLLGTIGDPNAINWYTGTANAFQGPAWEGLSSGWIESKYKLVPLNGFTNAQFRFVFQSDNSITRDGYSIDNFEIIPGPQIDMAMINVISPTSPTTPNSQDTVILQVQNQGILPASGFTVGYTVNGQPTTINYALPVNPGQSITLGLPSFTVPSGAYQFCAFVIATGDGDLSNDKICTTDLFNGINTFTEGGIKVYPTIANQQLHISVPSQEQYSVNIFSAEGKLLYDSQLNLNQEQLSISHLPNGVYFVSVLHHGATVHHQKVLIIR